jgi:hypothetical protein
MITDRVWPLLGMAHCVDLCCEILDEEELVSSTRRAVHSDMQHLIPIWIDSIDPADMEQIREVKELLETTLSRLNEMQSAEDKG